MADDVQLVMPKLGLTMTEGTVTEWRVQPGASFKTGDILFVVETEKIANEVEAPGDGTLTAQLVNTGETVPVGAPVGRWRAGAGGAVVAAPTPAAAPVPAPKAEPKAAPAPKPQAKPVAAVPVHTGGRIIATPLAKRIAKEKGVDLRGVTGSGPNGRIKAVDVENAPRRGEAAQITTAAPAAPASFFLMATARINDLTNLKKQIAALGGMDQVSLAHFAVLAAAPALAQSPAASSDIAVSVGGAAPALLREAAHLRLSGIVAGLAEGAEGAAAMAIVDAGAEDVTYLNVALQPGQAATLGIGAVQAVFKPDADGKPKLVEEIGLTLTCDSAVFDTAAGLKLLSAIKATLENPLRILAA
jgi:pyruvate dehydrogenase E2 component (dihydrolipoamide acetyltransferase)